MDYKIHQKNINNANIDIFGNWINLNLKINNEPFKHIIIDNFFNQNYLDIFPDKPNEHFWKYENPLEVKFALDKPEYMHPSIKNIFNALSHYSIINIFSKLFNIADLEYDPTLHGAGIHLYPKYGRLNIHLDYEKHPIFENKQRRLNIIIYMNDIWDDNWEGATELWDINMTKCIIKSYPKYNRAIIFETTEISWHGVPEIIKCPEKIFRKSLAYYYISPLINNPSSDKIGANNTGYRNKATFIKRPTDIENENMNKLYKIRPNRRITSNDIWAEWNIKL